jgi:para-aminobenzoate synthetase component I
VYFLQIYNVKRTWKALQNPEENVSDKLHRLFFRYNVAVSFTGNGWSGGPLLGFGAISTADSLAGIDSFRGDYAFGHLAYDLTRGQVHAEDGFTHLGFFIPEIVLRKQGASWFAGYHNETGFEDFCRKLNEDARADREFDAVQLHPVTSREAYLKQCSSLLEHIQRGDIYEINYCVDFSSSVDAMNPLNIFHRLNGLSDAPMSCLYRNGNSWLMCASPERFISRSGNKLISQPIKGTIRRGTSEEEDQLLRKKLYNDPKERSENVMIVDLVRNDLSRVAQKSSVKVSELFGIHTFKTVHQMISTIECEVKAETRFRDIIDAAFPMGSMTGAPKISAMNLAEKHESQPRGIYSGTVGMILPNGDFDFNVVIRSITWNSVTGYVSAKAGGAITASSIPEKEYEECILKAKAMIAALNPASA